MANGSAVANIPFFDFFIERNAHIDPSHTEDFIAPKAFIATYYFIFIPLAYVGNLLTCIVIAKKMRYRHRTPDVLVAGLALNDFLTCMVVFTPSIVARVVRHSFGSTFCQYHAVTTTWYILTTFAIIVLMSVERWLAIVKPFYHQRALSTLQMKLVIALIGLSCLLLGSIPTAFYPVTLQVGWYCSITTWIEDENGTMIHSGIPPLLSLAINLTYISVGIVLMLGFTGHTIYTLHHKPNFNTGQRRTTRRLEKRFTHMMQVVTFIFLLTWMPSLVSLFICLRDSYCPLCLKSRYYSSRVVNMGVALNPFIYGVMKPSYQRAYIYLMRNFLHYVTCTLVPAPQESERDIFEQGRQQYRVQFTSPNNSHKSASQSTSRGSMIQKANPREQSDSSTFPKDRDDRRQTVPLTISSNMNNRCHNTPIFDTHVVTFTQPEDLSIRKYEGQR